MSAEIAEGLLPWGRHHTFIDHGAVEPAGPAPEVVSGQHLSQGHHGHLARGRPWLAGFDHAIEKP